MKQREWKDLFIAYFSFSARERTGILVLVLLILLLFIAPDFLPETNPSLSIDDSSVISLIDRWRADSSSAFTYSSTTASKKSHNNSSGQRNSNHENHTGKLFFFDPNTASHDDLIALGLRDKTAATIIRYRNKGGRFRKPEDINRIFGLSPSLASRLQPYVRIKIKYPDPPENVVVSKTREGRGQLKFPDKPASLIKIEINLADSLQWLSLPGIGPKLTSRILLFRQRLGGFNSVEQVAEVYGLTDSVFQIILPMLVAESDQLKQISINQAGKAELAQHPYIRHQLAGAIVQYREVHGPFTQIEEIRRIHLVTEQVFEKIRPYLKIP